MIKKLYASIAVFVFIAGGVAIASETQRYTLERTADGYVRMQTQTGETSICTQQGDKLICRMSVDDREAYDTDIAALELKIDSLEKRLAALEQSKLPNALPSPAIGDEQDFQTSLNRMEQFFRRFMGIVKEFQVFADQPAPLPDRT